MKKTSVGVKNKKRIAIGFIILAVLMILLAFRVHGYRWSTPMN